MRTHAAPPAVSASNYLQSLRPPAVICAGTAAPHLVAAGSVSCRCAMPGVLQAMQHKCRLLPKTTRHGQMRLHQEPSPWCTPSLCLQVPGRKPEGLYHRQCCRSSGAEGCCLGSKRCCADCHTSSEVCEGPSRDETQGAMRGDHTCHRRNYQRHSYQRYSCQQHQCHPALKSHSS